MASALWHILFFFSFLPATSIIRGVFIIIPYDVRNNLLAHRRLMDKMSDAQAEVKTLTKKLKDSEQQVANMRQQLQKYVQEVKKAEDLLTQKVSLVGSLDDKIT